MKVLESNNSTTPLDVRTTFLSSVLFMRNTQNITLKFEFPSGRCLGPARIRGFSGKLCGCSFRRFCRGWLGRDLNSAVVRQESLDACVIQTVDCLPLGFCQHHAISSPWGRLASPPHGRVVRNLLPVRPNPLVGLCQAVPTQPNFCQAAVPLFQQSDHLKYRAVLLTLNICWEPAQPQSYCPGWQEPS